MITTSAPGAMAGFDSAGGDQRELALGVAQQRAALAREGSRRGRCSAQRSDTGGYGSRSMESKLAAPRPGPGSSPTGCCAAASRGHRNRQRHQRLDVRGRAQRHPRAGDRGRAAGWSARASRCSTSARSRLAAARRWCRRTKQSPDPGDRGSGRGRGAGPRRHLLPRGGGRALEQGRRRSTTSAAVRGDVRAGAESGCG